MTTFLPLGLSDLLNPLATISPSLHPHRGYVVLDQAGEVRAAAEGEVKESGKVRY